VKVPAIAKKSHNSPPNALEHFRGRVKKKRRGKRGKRVEARRLLK